MLAAAGATGRANCRTLAAEAWSSGCDVTVDVAEVVVKLDANTEPSDGSNKDIGGVVGICPKALPGDAGPPISM